MIDIETKVCSKCCEEKLLNCFGTAKVNKDGLRGTCKDCNKKRNKKYRADNKQTIAKQQKQYNLENKEIIAERRKIYRSNNKEERREYMQQYKIDKKEDISKNKKSYYKENILKIKLYKKQHRLDSKYSIAEYKKQYRLDNKDKLAKYILQYRKDNEEKYSVYFQSRRAKKKLLPHTLTALQWRNAQQYFERKCCFCGKETALTQEHFLAVDNGGGYTKENIIPSCKSCNSSKWKHNCLEWYKKQEFYSEAREAKILSFLGYKNNIQQFTLTI